MYILTTDIGSVCAYIFRRGRLCCLFSKGQPRPRYWISKCSACAFFMDLSGNKDLLDRPLVAFFASRNAPPEALELATRWAQEIAQTDKIVISGFHSPIERAVVDVLLTNGCSVVVTLGRSLYRKIPAHLQAAYDENNCFSYRSATTPATHIATPRFATGQPLISQMNSSSPHLMT